jgi:hypothetical protein
MLSYHYLKRNYELTHEFRGDLMEDFSEFNYICILYSINENDNMTQILNSILENDHEDLLDRDDKNDRVSSVYIDEKLDITNYKTNKKFLKKIKDKSRYCCNILIDYKLINDSNIGLFIELIDWLLSHNKLISLLTFSINKLNNLLFTKEFKSSLNLNTDEVIDYISLFEYSHEIKFINNDNLKNYIKNYKHCEDKLLQYYLSKINVVNFYTFNNQLNWLPSHITYLQLEIDSEINYEIHNLPINLKYLSLNMRSRRSNKIFKPSETLFLPIGLKYLKLDNIILNNNINLPYTIEFLEICNNNHNYSHNASDNSYESYADNGIDYNNIKNLACLLNDLHNLKCLIIKENLVLDASKNKLVFPETLKFLVINNIRIVNSINETGENILDESTENLDEDVYDLDVYEDIDDNDKLINELIKFPDTLEELYICNDYIDECKKININNGNCLIDSYHDYKYINYTDNYMDKNPYNYDINTCIFPNKYIGKD